MESLLELLSLLEEEEEGEAAVDCLLPIVEGRGEGEERREKGTMYIGRNGKRRLLRLKEGSGGVTVPLVGFGEARDGVRVDEERLSGVGVRLRWRLKRLLKGLKIYSSKNSSNPSTSSKVSTRSLRMLTA